MTKQQFKKGDKVLCCDTFDGSPSIDISIPITKWVEGVYLKSYDSDIFPHDVILDGDDKPTLIAHCIKLEGNEKLKDTSAPPPNYKAAKAFAVVVLAALLAAFAGLLYLLINIIL